MVALIINFYALTQEFYYNTLKYLIPEDAKDLLSLQRNNTIIQPDELSDLNKIIFILFVRYGCNIPTEGLLFT